MAHYVIGDVQGCLSVLKKLLALLDFNPGRDTIWFAGDLVNRGPQSLETLRFVKSHAGSMQTVLGNHDLYLLYMAREAHPLYKKKDTIAPILEAPDKEVLLSWLSEQPLYLATGETLVVHAGVYPDWSVADTKKNGDELSSWLEGERAGELFKEMYGDLPDLPEPNLPLFSRLRFNLNVLTRMRALYREDMRLNFKFKEPLNQLPENLEPWFNFANPHLKKTRVFFGHWSALGFHESLYATCLDTGAVWGGNLTAYNLGTGEIASVTNDAVAPLF